MEHLAQPPAGSRGNGLDALGWSRVTDCDPRLTDDLLSLLADAAIAACAVASPGERGAYLEVRAPRRPVDRIYVDSTRRVDAAKLVSARLERPLGQLTGPASPSAQDEAFEAIVAGFSDEVGPIVWPDAENVSAPPRRAAPPPGLLDPGGLLGDPPLPGDEPLVETADDDHYRPPPAPPAPRWRGVTKAAVAAIVAGVLFVIAIPLGLFTDTALASVLGSLLIVGGAVSLVLHLGDEPHDGDGTRV